METLISVSFLEAEDVTTDRMSTVASQIVGIVQAEGPGILHWHINLADSFKIEFRDPDRKTSLVIMIRCHFVFYFLNAKRFHSFVLPSFSTAFATAFFTLPDFTTAGSAFA